ncbi:MAG TPA: hypothetical protein VMV52_02980 [Candidatus Nanopelagicaceae bacterium]|nr:hypothetical protein [Candidatus Nanopelagicaceae bacterium]
METQSKIPSPAARLASHALVGLAVSQLVKHLAPHKRTLSAQLVAFLVAAAMDEMLDAPIATILA